MQIFLDFDIGNLQRVSLEQAKQAAENSSHHSIDGPRKNIPADLLIQVTQVVQ
jgi:hypothetical protein